MGPNTWRRGVFDKGVVLSRKIATTADKRALSFRVGRELWTITALTILLLPGCLLLSSAPERPEGPGEETGSTDAGSDTATDQDASADTSTGQDVTTDPSADADVDETPRFATLSGNVSRSTDPKNGGVGPLYIAVLERNPITSPGTDILGVDVVPSADLSESDASVPYSVEGIPVSDEPYFVLAFLDDDSNASTVYPTPNKPDLIAIVAGVGVTLPTITLAEEGDYELDLVLNLEYPF